MPEKCFSIKVLIINSAEKGVTEFVKPIELILKSAGVLFSTVNYSDIYEIDINEYNAYIISGSPRGDDIVAHHKPYFQWIRNIGKPVFGICAGHHIIGSLFGANLIRDKEAEIGDCQVEILEDNIIFKGLKKILTVNQNHNDSIDLPKDFFLLASSEKCNVEMMKHKERSIYSTQFHPEIHNKELLINFLNIGKSI